jgi:nitrogen fixation protein NifZ
MRETENELAGSPRFRRGEKVQAIEEVRNDGTFPGRVKDDILISPGDIGYVRDIGVFLQRFYIYSIEFVDLRIVVGLRAGELCALETPERDLR